MKKIFALILTLALVFSLAACGSEPAPAATEAPAAAPAEEAAPAEAVKIVVGASSTPHAEILEQVKAPLAEAGYELEIVVYDDYVLPTPLSSTATWMQTTSSTPPTSTASTLPITWTWSPPL